MEAAQGRENPTPAGQPPVADVRPKKLEAHGETRVDDYYWMRERTDPDVLQYLADENGYAQANLARSEALQEELFGEFVERLQETDMTVPVRSGPFEYFTRTFAGKAHPVHYRRSAGGAGEEVVLFDVNQLSQGSGFFSLGSRVPSDDHSKIAYAVDRVGRRIYDIEVKNVRRGNVDRGIKGTTGSVEWSKRGDYLFYVKRDPETLRAFQVWRHQSDTPPSMDKLVFEETDETFSCGIRRSRSGEYLMIESRQTLATEVRLLRADEPTGEWQVVLPRETGHEYHVSPVGERLYIRTNRSAENFRLVIAPRSAPDRWTNVLPHRADVLLMDVDVFDHQLVVRERRAGLVRLLVHPTSLQSGFQSFEIPFKDPAYSVALTGNKEFDAHKIRYEYSSMNQPKSIIEFDVDRGEARTLKVAKVGGGFDPANYVSKRIFAEAPDGAQVPVSIVYRKDRGEQPGPLLLYGYGSYGFSQDVSFNAPVISLLDRGFAYAIAHVRGGQELGRAWYEYGKLAHKMNTFTDFIACGEHLVDSGLTEPGQLYAMGGSAGGLLMGAVANMRPDLFHGMIAAVPFVDVVTTMLDETIPLTTFEYDEWGNPNEEEAYRTMLAYSPYDQVDAHAYPNMLVTTGFHDSQVQYWEPAKWVAKLRATMTGDSVLLFDCEMDAGHGGVSGRYDRLRKRAQSYAFLLWLQAES
jgi:oligopeptidase B